MKTLFIQCPKCGTQFNCISKHGDKRKFCSRGCANSRTWDDAKKARHSLIAKNSASYKSPQTETRVCPCGADFITKPFRKKRYCCHSCSVTLRPKNKKSGGYREGSGRSKAGYYRGFYCGSTYELCWVIYHLDNNFSFKRFEGCLEKDGLKYFPDFLVGMKKIVEIKGYWTEAVDKKTKVAESLGYTVEVLYKKDLAHIFDYVTSEYKTKKFHTLYDKHKPNYTGICCYCKKQFSCERRKPKTDVVFCSRSCCGKYRKVKNTPCR